MVPPEPDRDNGTGWHCELSYHVLGSRDGKIQLVAVLAPHLAIVGLLADTGQRRWADQLVWQQLENLQSATANIT